MHLRRASIVLCCCTSFVHAQAPKGSQPSLTDLRAKYDAPFTRNLQSFDCAVDFSWKQHWTETTRVGDEGSDEELATVFQPIRNRVVVTGQQVTPVSGMTDDAIGKLPHGGMAEFLLEHAVQKSLGNWLAAGTNSILPDSPTPVQIQSSSPGYMLAFKVQAFDVEMLLAPDLRLLGARARGPQSDHFETEFSPGPQGFLLNKWTVTEDGNDKPGHRIIFTYTYQAVDGIQLPEHVAIVRESHHEVWRYTLKDCIAKTNK